jgi:hypothetical protein
MYNGEDIKRRQLELKNNLLKGFGVGINEVDEDEFEKAHKQGDLHPNGKWYWESSAAGGKGDWRTIGGRRHKASQANVSTEEKKDSTKKKDSESDITKLNNILSKLKNGDTSVKKLLDAKEKEFLKKLGFELDERIGRGLLAVKSKEPWKLANEIESYMSKNGDSSKKTSSDENPAKELEAVNMVIASIKEGKLKLPPEGINALLEKKNNLELAKRQAEKIHLGVKANEEKRNAAEVKETNKKINEAQKKASGQASESDKEDLRAAREKLGYLQDNEERLIKRDGKEKYDKRLKQAKEEVSKLKGNKEPEKKVYDVTLGWNKKDQSTYNQIDKITDILEERGELSDWPFRSISQAQKRISFSEASNIISALKRGERIKIYI